MKNKIARSAFAATVAAGSLVSGLAQADGVQASTEVLESRIKQMEESMRMMQQELNRVRTDAVQPSERVDILEERVTMVERAPKKKNNMVFFRGGWGRNDHSREGSILTDSNALNEGTGGNVGGLGVTTSQLTGNSPNGDEDGWYFGAGFDLALSDDLFGLWEGTNLLGEITFSYKQFSSKNLSRAPLGTAANDSATGAAGAGELPAAVCGGVGNVLGVGDTAGLVSNGGGPYGSCSANVTVSQLTITASPKIKFMEGSKLRPWIIPAGFAIHVVSPPSDGVTVTAPGIMFGGGADYELWNNIHIGFDGRYNLVSNTTADVALDGFEVGGYLGFGF